MPLHGHTVTIHTAGNILYLSDLQRGGAGGGGDRGHIQRLNKNLNVHTKHLTLILYPCDKFSFFCKKIDKAIEDTLCNLSMSFATMHKIGTVHRDITCRYIRRKYFISKV
jgi:hypothetical protein